jgi:hypothetical protein
VNEYGKQFEEIFKKTNFENVLKEETIIVDKQSKKVLRFIPNDEIVDLCIETALEKAKHTMVYNQNATERTPKEKVVNAFRGILAETVVHIFLVKYCGLDFEKVKRFDMERESFKYSTEEYDINIYDEDKVLRLECRSSASWTKSIANAYASKPIVGPYTNSKKKKEEQSELYSCVLYQYSPNFCKGRDVYKEKDSLKLDTIKDICNGNLLVYLPSGALKEEMFGPLSEKINYGQVNTEYQSVAIKKVGDIEDYKNKILKEVS